MKRSDKVEENTARRTAAIIALSSAAQSVRLDRSLAREKALVVVRCSDVVEEVFACCQRLRPCVLIVDQSFVERQDPAWFAETIEFGRAVQVLVYVPMELPAVVEKLLRMGCMGVLPQNISSRAVRRAIQAVTSGQIWASRQVLSGMLQAELMTAYPRRLTGRETEILRLIAKGYKNREIAEKLFISRETVRWHVRSLYSKISVQDRLSATFYATEHGYLRSGTNAKTEPDKKPPKSLGSVPSANTTVG